MKKLQPRDFSRLATTQQEAFNDVCHIHHLTLSSGTYSTKVTETRTSITGVHCGIKLTGGTIVQRGETIFVEYDAILRLPASQSVAINDDIELIEKGEFVISGTFKPYGMPVVNSSIQHVNLKRGVP